jgi:hypothetical protein
LSEDEAAEKPKHQDEREEDFVVAFADAGAYPGAVMVKPFDAHVAVVAVRGAWGSVDTAGAAELYFKVVGFELHGVDALDISYLSTGVSAVDGYLTIKRMFICG